MSEAYSEFATVYDQLMDNIPYTDWFSYLHNLLIEYGIDCGIVADLGCGTGNITELMAASGYDMIGIDYSVSMLDIANEKKQNNNSGTLYLCQDMRDFELYGTVSAFISICDSVNYITETDDLEHVFTLVNNYLDPKGVFIFDFNTKYYYSEIVADSTIAEDRDNISFIWDNYFDEETNLNELALSLFVQERNDLYRKYEEIHIQRGYNLEQMIKIVKTSGLEFLNAYDAFTHDTATEKSERIYIIARENGK